MVACVYTGLTDREILDLARAESWRALSVRQPYAEAILDGRKTAEYRSRPTRVRGPVLLYAGQRADWLTDAELELPRGVIVGVVTLTGSEELADCHGWLVAHPHRFAMPVERPAGRQPQPAFWLPFPALGGAGKKKTRIGLTR